MDKENLDEELKGLSKEIREELIQEAKKRGYHITYNEDGSIDINGMHILTFEAPFDLDKEDNKGSE